MILIYTKVYVIWYAYLVIVLGALNNYKHPGYTTCIKFQPRYAIKLETYKYSSILSGYNKMYMLQIDFKKETTNPDNMKIKDELVLNSMNWESAGKIEYNTICAFQTSDINTPGYYIIIWTGNPYTL